MMTRHHLILLLALGGLVSLAPGCGRKAETEKASPGMASPPKPVETAAPPAKAVPENPIKPSPVAPTNAPAAATTNALAAVTNAGTVAAPATNAVADNPATAQELIDSARKLVAEQKWPEVLQTLSKLQGATLTPEQTKSLLDLKEQLEKAIRDAVGK